MFPIRLKHITTLLLFLASSSLISQETASYKNDSLILAATGLSAIDQFDSSNMVISLIDRDQLSKKELELLSYTEKLNSGQELSYKAYRDIGEQLMSTKNISIAEVVHFMMHKIPAPTSDTIPRDYILIQFSALNMMSNFLSLEDVVLEKDSLKAYVQTFDQNHPSTLRALVILLNQDFTLAQINVNTELMYTIYLEIDSLSSVVGDPFLLALSEYVAMGFYVASGDLDNFLKAGEKCLTITKTDDAAYYFTAPALEFLLNGYIYQATNFERIQELITELRQIKSARWQSYIVFAQYLRILPANSPILLDLFNEFEVDNIYGFINALTVLAEEELQGKDLLDYYETLTTSLSELNEDSLALVYSSNSNQLVKKIYTKEISSSIASVETEYALKAKNAELENERAIQEIYQTALFVGGIIVLFLIVLLVFIRKQYIQLDKKNSQISLQRDQLAKSEKEIGLLLKEVHHRVKNNFQIVSSLLELQFRNVDDEQTQSLLQEGKNRVQSMAFIHQQLYQNDQLHIEFDVYVPKLISELQHIYGSTNIQTDIQIPTGLALDIDTAIPVGLILNELLTNAMKYGFGKDDKQLAIHINKQEAGNYSLIVMDNGQGLPEGTSLATTTSMGLRLVRRLAKQLQGSVDYNSTDGCTFSVQFKDAIARKQVD